MEKAKERMKKEAQNGKSPTRQRSLKTPPTVMRPAYSPRLPDWVGGIALRQSTCLEHVVQHHSPPPQPSTHYRLQSSSVPRRGSQKLCGAKGVTTDSSGLTCPESTSLVAGGGLGIQADQTRD